MNLCVNITCYNSYHCPGGRILSRGTISLKASSKPLKLTTKKPPLRYTTFPFHHPMGSVSSSFEKISISSPSLNFKASLVK